MPHFMYQLSEVFLVRDAEAASNPRLAGRQAIGVAIEAEAVRTG
jgi:hypothetical protein